MKRLLCLLLAFALTLCLAACGDQPTPTEPSVIELPTEAPTEAPTLAPTEPSVAAAPTDVTELTAAPTEAPMEEAPIPVSDAVRFTRNFRSDDVDWTLNLAIPRIDLELDTITRLNKVIYDQHSELFFDGVASLRNGGAPQLNNMDYTASLRGNALSVVISIAYSTDITQIHSYCVDINTGNLMTQAGIAAVMGVTTDELLQAIANAAEKQFSENYPSGAEEDLYDILLSKTLAEDNLAQAQCFFDGDGQLMAAVAIYSPVGAKYYTHTLPIYF